jgi:hypothetical protein
VDIKEIQTFVFDKKVHSLSAWAYDFLVPGKDKIDVSYAPGTKTLFYSYRGQSNFSLATLQVSGLSEDQFEEGDLEVVTYLEDRRALGDSLICQLRDVKRRVLISILKGASTGSISVHKE